MQLQDLMTSIFVLLEELFMIFIKLRISYLLANLLQTLRHKIDFKGGKTSLRKVLLQLGFKWLKTKTNRKILIEKNDIRDKRIAYLREINRLRKQGRPIIYMDETYILSSHTSSKAWSDDSSEGLHCPVSKGDRLIIVHAGGENGFVENTPDVEIIPKFG